MLTKLGLVKKKFSFPRAAAQAEGREREDGEPPPLSPATDRHTHACCLPARSRSVSLQKGTNQPATRMSLNRSQRSCRSTKYGTQAKT